MPVQSKISLPGYYCLAELTAWLEDSESLLDIFIGNDEAIYLLYVKNYPSRVMDSGGTFTPSTGEAEYKAIKLTVDWQQGTVIGREVLKFGRQNINIHFLQPIEENFLLLGARAKFYNSHQVDNNAIITDKQGTIIKQFCFGDGIQDCLVDKHNRIIISFFDEGVFGNYGWEQPIGQCGIMCRDQDGNIIWQNREHDICDCYAINLDAQDNLWFYYYPAFNLVKTDYQHEVMLKPNVEGSSTFALSHDQQFILFDKGYDQHNQFVSYRIEYNQLLEAHTCVFTHHQHQITAELTHFRGSCCLLLQQQTLYFGRWSGESESNEQKN